MKIARTVSLPVRIDRRGAQETAGRARSRGRAALPLDLAIGLVAALAGTATVALEGPVVLRVLLGLPLLLFLPGYAIVSALFPRAAGLDGVERVAVGFGLSLTTIPLVALGLDHSPWSVARVPVAIALLLVTVTASAVAVVRRVRAGATDRYAAAVRPPRLPRPRSWDWPLRLGVGAMIGAFLLLAVGGASAVYTRFAGQPLTEFALYNPEGRAAFYDRQLPVGEPAALLVEVTNREGGERAYSVVVGGAAAAVDPPPSIALADGEAWSGTVRFVVGAAGQRLPVQFDLRRADDPPTAAPYRSLRLMVDAVAAGGPVSARPTG